MQLQHERTVEGVLAAAETVFVRNGYAQAATADRSGSGCVRGHCLCVLRK